MKVTTVLVLSLILLLGAACSTTATPTAIPTLAPAQIVKRLATVQVPPTLDPLAQQSTRSAARPTSTPPLPTPTPTAYIGIFMGDSSGGGEGVPDVNANQYLGTLVALSPPTFPTLGVQPCIIPPNALYGSNWAVDPVVRDSIGCPGEPMTSYIGAAVFFERGVMYSLPTGEIYTVASGGTESGRYWYAPFAPPEQSWGVDVPQGLLLPTGVYGAIWRAVDGVRQTIGFAQTGEQPVSVSLQRFENGALLLDGTAGQTFAFIGITGGGIGEGVVYGPFSAD